MSHQLPELPVLPRSLLNQIGEYGMARTDKVSQLEVEHRWMLLIAGIKQYTQAYAELAIASVKREPLSTNIVDALLPAGQDIDEHDLHFFARAIEQAHGIGALDDKAQSIKYPSSTASPWLPIESAPGDGLFVAKGNRFNDPAKGEFYIIAERDAGGFIDDADDCLSPFLTHWMPLPPPPIKDPEKK